MRRIAIPDSNDKIFFFLKKKTIIFFSLSNIKKKKCKKKKKEKNKWVADHPQKALGWQRHPWRASQWIGEAL
jgi:hypothetical protein